MMELEKDFPVVNVVCRLRLWSPEEGNSLLTVTASIVRLNTRHTSVPDVDSHCVYCK